MSLYEKSLTRKQCVKFFESENKDICQGCGYTKLEHTYGRKNTQFGWTKLSKSWKEQLCVYNVTKNIHGKIKFQNEEENIEKVADYSIVAYDTEAKVIVENILFNRYRMKRPKFVISINGGPTKVEIKSDRAKRRFKEGFIRATTASFSWVITNGTTLGFDGYISSMLKQYTLLQWTGTIEPKFHQLGIANWNCIEHHQEVRKWEHDYKVTLQSVTQKLLQQKNPKETTAKTKKGLKDPFPYRCRHYPYVSKYARKFYMPLNGMVDKFVFSESGILLKANQDVELRSEIELYLAQQLQIPVVHLMFGGDFISFKRVYNAVKMKIPIVVCEGSGFAADILCHALDMANLGTHSFTKKKIQTLVDKMLSLPIASGELFSRESIEVGVVLKYIEECCTFKEYIFRYNIKDHEDSLDGMLLKALLHTDAIEEDKLKMLVLWNNCDENVREILEEEADINKRKNIGQLATYCIDNEQVEFIEVFMNYGFSFKRFLTTDILAQLYQSTLESYRPLKTLLAKKIGKKKRYSLNDIYEIIIISCSVKPDLLYSKYDTETILEDPFAHIAIWAMFSNKQKICYYCWRFSSTPLMLAIVISEMWRVHGTALTKDEQDLKFEMLENEKEYNDLVNDLTSVCWETSKTNCKAIVAQKLPLWGNKCTLDAAGYCDAKEYIAASCSQSVISQQWNNSLRMTLRGAFVGVLNPFSIKRLALETSDDEINEEEEVTIDNNQKFKLFYRSPACKFITHTINYVIFLLIASYHILRIMKPHFIEGQSFEERAKLEYVVFSYYLANLLDLIRQVLTISAPWRLKLAFWIKSEWNIVDAIYLSTGITAFILNSIDKCHHVACMLYIITILLQWIHLVRFYQCSEKLGQIWIMIRKMLAETLIFMSVFAIVIMSAGICIHCINNKEQLATVEFQWLFLKPFFMANGNFFVKQMNEGENRIFTYFVLIFYLFFGQALLLNLLIAMYGKIFNTVLDNATTEWKNELLSLLIEYNQKTFVPQPLGLIETFVRVSVEIHRKIFPNKNVFKKADEVLKTFENICLRKMLKRKEKEMDTDKRVNYLQQKEDEQERDVNECIYGIRQCRNVIDQKRKRRLRRRMNRKSISTQTECTLLS